MGCKEVIIKGVSVRCKTQCAVSNVIFNTSLQLKYTVAYFSQFNLKMDLVTEVAIVIAYTNGIVYMIEYGTVGNTCKKSIASPYRSLIGEIGIDVMLFKTQVALVLMKSDRCEIVTYV